MVRGRRLQGMATALTVAMVLAVPTVASATPQWRINGGLIAEATKEGVLQFGTLTLKNAILGEFQCKTVAGGSVWNESGKGLYAVEGWEQGHGPSRSKGGPIEAGEGQSLVCGYAGSGPGCKESSFLTVEPEPELLIESEKFKPLRGKRSLPWPGELFETTEKTISLNIHKIKIFIACPTEGLEVPFEGNLEPKVRNGVKNGMSPSKLVFEGKGGKTSWLGTCSFGVPCESEEHNLYVSGELTLLGTRQQLITAR